jgi:hypothetical protein
MLMWVLSETASTVHHILNRQAHIRKARYVQQDFQYDDIGVHCMLKIKSSNFLMI